MSFYNQQQYLDNLVGQGEMQIREEARLFANASSPEKRRLMRLAEIPEATPGPNAFAQQEEQIERHRLNSNAFYQQEMQRRIASPPTLAHPALRQRSFSDPPTPPRASSCTTMSPFINAGASKENSPLLKLVPSYAHLAEPTSRGFIEERREQQHHELSGSEQKRTPVFMPTSTFAQPWETPKRRSEKQKEVTIAEAPPTEIPSKTPKRSLLEKLRLNTSFRASTGSPSGQVEQALECDIEPMPVKAKAVLGASPTKKKGRISLGSSPSKSNLPRSPSKRKGLFARKTSGLAEPVAPPPDRTKSSLSSVSADFDRPPLSASTIVKTPPTAFSDPTHYSYNHKLGRYTFKTLSDAGEHPGKVSPMTRSKSLKCFDNAIPPTPLPKDTPPEEKAKRQQGELASKPSRLPVPCAQSTPSRSPLSVISSNEQMSPAKFGSIGQREAATLVTMPSMYSLHASVVPGLNDATTFEEMKARVDGLGLEGFNTPSENLLSPKLGSVYSPSIYSTDWDARPNSAFAITPKFERPVQHAKRPSDESKESGTTIQMVYPELAKDPSYSDILAGSTAKQQARGRAPDHLDANIPWHGRTHSRDHSSDSRHSKDSTLFARHVDDCLDVTNVYDSPTSFSHASATPSPLHTLPVSTYKPPPRKSDAQALLIPAHAKERPQRGLGIDSSSRDTSESPSRRNRVFENVPRLPAQTATPTAVSSSPVNSPQHPQTATQCNSEPQKASPSKSPAVDKLDCMIEMLNQLKSRNDEVINIRDEMRKSNARLGQRLAAIETVQRSSPVPPSQASEEPPLSARLRPTEREQHRVSTDVAHDFYKSYTSGRTSPVHTAENEQRQADTIAELRAMNARLLEMVTGFSERILTLEGRSGNGEGA